MSDNPFDLLARIGRGEDPFAKRYGVECRQGVVERGARNYKLLGLGSIQTVEEKPREIEIVWRVQQLRFRLRSKHYRRGCDLQRTGNCHWSMYCGVTVEPALQWMLTEDPPYEGADCDGGVLR